MDERWLSKGGEHHGFTFLDASCLVYGDMASVPAPLRKDRSCSYVAGAGGPGAPWGGRGGRGGGGGAGRRPYTCPPVLGGQPLELLGIVDYCSRHGPLVGKAVRRGVHLLS